MQDKGLLRPERLVEAIIGDYSNPTAAKKEFDTFVIKTWKELVRMETMYHGVRSIAFNWCRMDISVMKTGEGETAGLGYFVNEVERHLSATFWMKEEKLRQEIMPQYADAFHAWLSSM